MESSSINVMKHFETPNKYTSHYIKWNIGQLDNVEQIKSKSFKAGRVEFDDSSKCSLKWAFKYYSDVETKSINISLVRLSDDGCHFISRNVPIVCRLAITNEVTGITKYHSASFFESTYSMDSDYKWQMTSDEARDLDLPNGNYVVCCWLDVPTKVIDNEPPSSFVPRSNTALPLSGVASLFNEVVIRKTDESKGTSDIVVITNQGERQERRFYCHRAILSIRSPVFDTMLTYKGFKEGNDERDVEIEDVDGDVLEIVLKYIYTGEGPPNIPFASIPKVVDLAEKYMLPELKDECVRHLINREIPDDAWAATLTVAKTYNIDYLKEIASLALSSNVRVLSDEKIREKLTMEAKKELVKMGTKRCMLSEMLEVSNLECKYY